MTAMNQAWKACISPHENIDSDFQENVKANMVHFLQKRMKNNGKILAEV